MKKYFISLLVYLITFSVNASDDAVISEEEATAMFAEVQKSCANGCRFAELPLKFQKFLKSKQDLNKDKLTMSMNHTYTITHQKMEGHPAFVVRMTAVKGSEFRGNYMYTVYTNSKGTIIADSNKNILLRKTVVESLAGSRQSPPKKPLPTPDAPEFANNLIGPVSDRPLRPVPPLPPQTMKKIQAKIEHNENNSMALVPYHEPRKPKSKVITPPPPPSPPPPPPNVTPSQESITKKAVRSGDALVGTAAVKNHVSKRNKAKGKISPRPKNSDKMTEDSLLLSSLTSANTMLNE